jgi:hypothetical protein
VHQLIMDLQYWGGTLPRSMVQMFGNSLWSSPLHTSIENIQTFQIDIYFLESCQRAGHSVDDGIGQGVSCLDVMPFRYCLGDLTHCLSITFCCLSSTSFAALL